MTGDTYDERLRTTLTCGQWSYLLDSSASIAEFRHLVERTVRSGGGFVDVPVAGDMVIAIFVGPATQLRLVTRRLDVGRSRVANAPVAESFGELDFSEFA